ncbi:hypothetical protein CU098_007558 [Rhizopus stolonifer]|uniref:Thioredoxin domain-containing protein n=1 Tax=Rhizopus stolonifer TaxID=4846 RepID=A0A367JPG0_RHIST|nr:hypothetical protein CU098_007558 [Rhizopus stolonifer]
MIAQVQRHAPPFTAPGVSEGKIVPNISLADYMGRYVVFFWYPMDFTFVCPTEIIAFNDARDKFRALNCDVIAASGDSDYGIYIDHQGVSLRGLFIIDDKGIIRQITINDLPVGRSVEEVLRLVEAFQHTDKFGEDNHT